ncbi:MAG: cation-translocating P-type ATPase [Pseudomonadales bacterium]
MTLSTISVGDMHCAGCVGKVERALAALDGVLATHVNAARRQVLVEHDDATDPAVLLERIEAAGFHPHLTGSAEHSDSQRDLLKRLGVAGLAMMQVMMAAIALYAGALDEMAPAYRRLLELASLVFCIPVVSYSAMPFFVGALRSWRSGLNMDVPIALAIACAFSVSLAHTLSGSGDVYYDSVVMFTFLLLTARYIDDRLKQRFEHSNARLAAMPAEATVIENGIRRRAAIAAIEPGSEVWVGEGEQVPVDGLLGANPAVLDESALTGESVWVRRASGEQVFAGTLNQGAGFSLISNAPADRSRIAQIADLANRAQAEKPVVAQYADRIAGYFVPVVLMLAGLTWIVWQQLDPSRAFVAMLTVLVVSCPCALSLATPAAITAAMTRLRQVGVVLTRSSVLEQMRDLNAALLDKTGTLTIHTPKLVAIDLPAGSSLDEAEALDVAAALQRHASHPLARAFPEPQAARVEDVTVVSGAGVSGRWQGHDVRVGSSEFCTGTPDPDAYRVVLSIDGVTAARFALADPVRADAHAAIAALKRAGIAVTMVSGDSEARCASLARELDVPFVAQQAPETKLEVTRTLQQRGDRVLVLGDGINDVPALAAADVSAAVLESSDLVKRNADVLLLTRRLGALPELVTVGRRCGRIIRQNLAWALGYNLLAIPTAALGLMPPWVAALGMASSSTLVMLNAARLLGGTGAEDTAPEDR